MIVVAIDGPSGAGKSTVAKRLAEILDMPYLDTGAMYRAVAMLALQRDVGLIDDVSLVKLVAEMKLQMLDERSDGKLMPRVVVNGIDATLAIRTVEVSQAASAIAIHPQVRERLVKRQRNWVEERGGAVVEGRDIGTVVFPAATLKLYMTASDEERQNRRRNDEHAAEFANLSADVAAKEMAERDHRDGTRQASPMTNADDAVVIDTTGRDIEDIVTDVLVELRTRNGGELPGSNP